jgi:hypothetical protein
MVYSRAERVFILEHYFASKSFTAVRKAFSNVCSDKEIPNKTTVHRLVTKCRDTGSVCDRKHVQRRTVLTGDVEETLALSPRKSLRTFPSKVHYLCPYSSSDKTAEIMAYPFQAVNQLQQRDTAARIQHCHWFRRGRKGLCVGQFIFSDEALFHLFVIFAVKTADCAQC